MTIQTMNLTLNEIATYCDARGITVEQFIEEREVMHDIEIERQIDEMLLLNEYA